jgi:hypothetical protein
MQLQAIWERYHSYGQDNARAVVSTKASVPGFFHSHLQQKVSAQFVIDAPRAGNTSMQTISTPTLPTLHGNSSKRGIPTL